MKALVTGGTGFIGSHLVELLLAKNYSVRCLVRPTSDLQWLNGLPLEYIQGDLFDAEALRSAVKGVDYVYHSAGITKAKTKEEYYLGNTTGTRNILGAILAQTPSIKRFVHISSQAAVGPSPSKTPITEEMPPHPLTTYGKSKWMAEKACLQMVESIPMTILRPPVVYGPRDRDVLAFFSTISKGLHPIVGFNEKYVSMIHVRDLVRGFVLAAESNASVGQTYFIASKDVHGWKEIGSITQEVMNKRAFRVRLPGAAVYGIAACAELFGLFSRKPVLINFEKARDMVQDYWTCDASKAKRDFGFEQAIPLTEGISDTVRWYRDKGWL